MSGQEQRLEISVQDAQKPSEGGRRLVSIFNEMEKKQLDFLDEAGKSIIERVSTMLAVLFAITAFGNDFPPTYLNGNVVAKMLVVGTLVSYLSAMGAGLWGIHPRSYRHYLYNVSRLGNELERITKQKMLWLRIAGVLFSLGTVSLSALIISIIWPI